MSYFENDDLNIWRDVHHHLPKKIRNIAITNEMVIAKLRYGENKILISIEKWIKINEIVKFISEKSFPYYYYNELIKYVDYKSCALCLNAIEEFEKSFGKIKNKEDKCKVCSLSKIDQCTKNDSIFEQIENILIAGIEFLEKRHETISEKDLFKNHNKLEILVETMIKNLEDLNKYI